MARTVRGNRVDDGETFTLAAVVRDEANAVVDLTAGTVNGFITWYRADTNAALNTRNNQQFNTAGVSSNEHSGDASGNLTWNALAADTTLGASADVDVVARYRITFGTNRVLIHEIQFKVAPLVTVT